MEENIVTPIVEPKKKPILEVVLVVLLIISLITAGDLFYRNQKLQKQIANLSVQPTPSPTTDPTANWKTYENNEFGFIVKYPFDYKILFDEKTPIIMKPGGERDGTGAFSFYKISFTPLDAYTDLQSLIAENINQSKQTWGDNSPEYKSISSIYNVKVGDIDGLSYDMMCAGYCHHIFIKKDSTKYFQITVINANQNIKNMYQSEVDQILSTFKFTNQTSALDFPDWKTYMASAQKFIFKYPPSWYIDTDNSNILRFTDSNGKTGSVHITLGGRGGMTLEEPTRHEIIEYPAGKVEISEGKIPGQQVMEGIYELLGKPVINGREAPEQPVLRFEAYYQVSYLNEFRQLIDKVLKTVRPYE